MLIAYTIHDIISRLLQEKGYHLYVVLLKLLACFDYLSTDYTHLVHA